MTAVLREIVCAMNSTKNKDCCTNPGFCDYYAFRRCKAMIGCTDHFPHRSVRISHLYILLLYFTRLCCIL